VEEDLRRRYSPEQIVGYGVLAARAAHMHAFAFAPGPAGAALEGSNTTVFENMRDLPHLLRTLS
jgi:hypothetical protein